MHLPAVCSCPLDRAQVIQLGAVATKQGMCNCAEHAYLVMPAGRVGGPEGAANQGTASWFQVQVHRAVRRPEELVEVSP